jgi:hypothetical protein
LLGLSVWKASARVWHRGWPGGAIEEVLVGVGETAEAPEEVGDQGEQVVLEDGAGAEVVAELAEEQGEVGVGVLVRGVGAAGGGEGLGEAVGDGVAGGTGLALGGAGAGGALGVGAVGGELLAGERVGEGVGGVAPTGRRQCSPEGCG